MVSLASRSAVLRSVCFATLVTVATSGDAAAAALRTVALSNRAAPGTPSGVNFAFFTGAPALNDAGQVAFFGAIAGGGVTLTNNFGIWSEGAGALSLVARTGSAASGMPAGVTYSSFSPPTLNNAGQTGFFGAVAGSGVTSTNDTAVWSEGSDSLGLVAREGDQAPGAPVGATFRSLLSSRMLLNDAGKTVFRTELTGGGVTSANDSGIWSESGGSLALIAREGSQAPGLPSGVNFGSMSGLPRLNDAGQTAFLAPLTGNGVTSGSSGSLWSEGSGSLAMVSRTGDPAPGASSGVNYSGFSSPEVNGTGLIAFRGTLVGSGVNSTNDSGIWSEGSGNVAMVAREGSPAPGTSGGVNFAHFDDSPVLNDSGQIAFAAPLTGSGVDETNNQGVWLEHDDILSLIARTGNAAPGTPNGVKFSSFLARRLANTPAMNNAGQIAFVGFLAGSGVTGGNDMGLWATDLAGAIKLIVREGDALEVAPGDFRTVGTFDFRTDTGNGDGLPSGFNDRGQVALRVSFLDGTHGVFVSNLVAVPEPGGVEVVGVAVFAMASWSRRKRLNQKRWGAD